MKKIFITLVLIVFATFLLHSEIVFHVSGGYNLGFNFSDFGFQDSFDYKSSTGRTIVIYEEDHSTTMTGGSTFGFNGGITFYFTYSLGLGVEAGYYNAGYDIDQSFTWKYTWGNATTAPGVSNTQSKNWTGNEGNLTVIPLSLSLCLSAGI